MPVSETAYSMLTAAKQQGLGELDVAAIAGLPGAHVRHGGLPVAGLRMERREGDVIVDIHGHITHPELFKKYPMPPALADIDGMLDRKSEAGIGLTVVGKPGRASER